MHGALPDGPSARKPSSPAAPPHKGLTPFSFGRSLEGLRPTQRSIPPRILPKWPPPSPRPVSLGSRTPARCRPPPVLTQTQATTSARPPVPGPRGGPARGQRSPARIASRPGPAQPLHQDPPALITPPCQGPPQAQPRSRPHAPCAPLFRSHPPTAPGLGVHPKPRCPPPHRCLSPPRLVPSPAGPPGLSFSTRCPQRARPTPPAGPAARSTGQAGGVCAPIERGRLVLPPGCGASAGGWTSPSLTSHGSDQETRRT